MCLNFYFGVVLFKGRKSYALSITLQDRAMSEEIKYYTDEHVPSTVVAGLRRSGLTTIEVKKCL